MLGIGSAYIGIQNRRAVFIPHGDYYKGFAIIYYPASQTPILVEG